MDNLYRVFIINKKFKGFTLIELIIVIAVLGIVTAIAVPRFVGYRSLAVKKVCDANRNAVERLYIVFLLDSAHDDSNFNEFLIENFDEVCPAGGVITYEEGKAKCSVHEQISDKNEDEPPGDEVPWI